MRVGIPRYSAASFFSVLLAVTLLASSEQGSAQTQPSSQTYTPQTRLAVFTDRKAPGLSDDLWSELVASLREELASDSPEIQSLVRRATTSATDNSSGTDASSQIQIIREEQIVLGVAVNTSITVYLHGQCRINPHPPLDFPRNTHVSGALGWVNSDHGHIESFIHVDCNSLAQMLARRAYGLNSDQRDKLLASAIARVILHEWIHIDTQDAHHSEQGITKAQFGVADLLTHASKPVAQQRTPAPNSPSQAELLGGK
jgi:hypothetical protein